MRRLRSDRICKVLAIPTLLLLLIVIVNELFNVMGLKNRYTIQFLKQLSREELIVTTIEEVNDSETEIVTGIKKEEELIEPKTKADEKILQILDMAEKREFTSVPLQSTFYQIDENSMKKKVEVLDEKFSDKDIFIGMEEKVNEMGEKEWEKRIYVFPAGYNPDYVIRIEK